MASHLGHLAACHVVDKMPPRPTRAQCVAVMHRARLPLLPRALLATACAAPRSLGGAKAELPISSSPSPHSSASPYACLTTHSHGRHGRLPCRSATAAAGTAVVLLCYVCTLV
jgi:hypothetical protein